MTTLNHILSGAALGAISPNPGAAFFTGTLGHLLLDDIPHSEYDWPPYYFKSFKQLTKKQTILSVLFSVIIGGLLLFIMAYHNHKILSYNVLFGILGGIWIDFFDLAMPRLTSQKILKKPFFKQLHKLHIFFHTENEKFRSGVKLTYSFIVNIVALVILYFF